MAFALSELFWVGVVPCATAAVVMLLCRRFAVRSSVAWAVSFGCGLVVGQIGLSLRHGGSVAIGMLRHPNGARDWLPWLLLAVLGITILAAYSSRHWQRWILALACVFAIAAPIRLLAGSVYVTSRWSQGEKLAILALWSAAFLVLWFTLALGRTNGQPWLRGSLLVAVALGIAATITLSGAFTFGELSGVAAAALTGTILGELCVGTPASSPQPTPHHDGLSGAAGPIALVLGGLILLGYFYAELSATAAGLLAVALAAAAGRLPTVWPPTPTGRAAFRIALCLVPLVLAIALALTANSGDPYAS